MNDMSNTTKPRGLSSVTAFKSAAPSAPQARKPAAPLLGNLPPHKGYWQDPQTGVEFSGGMEIAPTSHGRTRDLG